MSLIAVILVCLVIGLLIWLFPMPDLVKKILIAICIIVFAVWLLGVLGLTHGVDLHIR